MKEQHQKAHGYPLRKSCLSDLDITLCGVGSQRVLARIMQLLTMIQVVKAGAR